jgi:hypothetical protein
MTSEPLKRVRKLIEKQFQCQIYLKPQINLAFLFIFLNLLFVEQEGEGEREREFVGE